MKIWVDADACPKVIKEILFRVANRLEVEVILVANQALATPPSAYIKSIQVTKGFDVADNYIVSQTRPEDLIITADIPLAAEIVEKGAHALNPRGELYDQNNIKERLTLRDAMDELRSSGLMSGGPAAFSHKDRQSFSNALDRFLAKVKKTNNL
ncbi:YaiI/YqxD family protein [Piscirickettsia salmonis]|uniref:YaiI/YqxD family protein n=1 Tax=Piscirickettsia salmonis TaxID=1238 RepID=UPI003A80AB7C